MTKVVTKVRVTAESTGTGPYQVDDLDREHDLEVFGTQLFEFSDGGTVACFIVPDVNWVLQPRAMRLFSVVDWKDE